MSKPTISPPTCHPRRTRTQGALARELDDPQRQSPARERRRPEGRRPSGLVRLARHHHDRALFRCAAAAGPRRGEAACQPDLPRHPVSARQPDPREARELPRLQGRAEPIPRAPRTPTTSISPPARSASASRRRCSPRWCRTMCARTAGDRSAGRPHGRAGRRRRDSTRAISSRRCSKAGSRACAIAGGSSTTTARASTPWCAKACGRATSSCSRISAGTS